MTKARRVILIVFAWLTLLNVLWLKWDIDRHPGAFRVVDKVTDTGVFLIPDVRYHFSLFAPWGAQYLDAFLIRELLIIGVGGATWFLVRVRS